MLDKPPDVIPDGLSAKEYHTLGTWYLESGDMDKARDALNRAIALDPEGDTGLEAQRFRDNRLPRHPVSDALIKKFHEISLSALTRPPAAEKAYLTMIEENPDFEWPLRGLGEIRLNKGDTKQALEFLNRSLTINPNNGPALILKTRASIAEGDYDQAWLSLAKAMEALPDNQDLRELRRSLEILVHIES